MQVFRPAKLMCSSASDNDLSWHSIARCQHTFPCSSATRGPHAIRMAIKVRIRRLIRFEHRTSSIYTTQSKEAQELDTIQGSRILTSRRTMIYTNLVFRHGVSRQPQEFLESPKIASGQKTRVYTVRASGAFQLLKPLPSWF